MRLIQLLFAGGFKKGHNLTKLPMLTNIVLPQLVRQQLFNIIFILLMPGFHIDIIQFK